MPVLALVLVASACSNSDDTSDDESALGVELRALSSDPDDHFETENATLTLWADSEAAEVQVWADETSDFADDVNLEPLGPSMRIEATTEGGARIEFDVSGASPDRLVVMMWRQGGSGDPFQPVIDAVRDGDRLVADVEHFSEYVAAEATFSPSEIAGIASSRFSNELRAVAVMAETRAEFPDCWNEGIPEQRPEYGVEYVGPAAPGNEPRLLACIQRRAGSDNGSHLLRIANNRGVAVEARLPAEIGIRHPTDRGIAALTTELVERVGEELDDSSDRKSVVIGAGEEVSLSIPPDLNPDELEIQFGYTYLTTLIDLVIITGDILFGTAWELAEMLIKFRDNATRAVFECASAFRHLVTGNDADFWSCAEKTFDAARAVFDGVFDVINEVLRLGELAVLLASFTENLVSGAVFYGAGTVVLRPLAPLDGVAAPPDASDNEAEPEAAAVSLDLDGATHFSGGRTGTGYPGRGTPVTDLGPLPCVLDQTLPYCIDDDVPAILTHVVAAVGSTSASGDLFWSQTKQDWLDHDDVIALEIRASRTSASQADLPGLCRSLGALGAPDPQPTQQTIRGTSGYRCDSYIDDVFAAPAATLLWFDGERRIRVTVAVGQYRPFDERTFEGPRGITYDDLLAWVESWTTESRPAPPVDTSASPDCPSNEIASAVSDDGSGSVQASIRECVDGWAIGDAWFTDVPEPEAWLILLRYVDGQWRDVAEEGGILQAWFVFEPDRLGICVDRLGVPDAVAAQMSYCTDTVDVPATTTTTTTDRSMPGIECPSSANVTYSDITDVASNDTLNVRSGPGTSNGVVWTYAHDAKGIITFPDATSGSWVMIALPGGVDPLVQGCGWVNSRFLAPEGQATVPTTGQNIGISCPGDYPRSEYLDVTGVASNDTLNVRGGPGTGFAVVDELAHNERGIQVLLDFTDGNWIMIGIPGPPGGEPLPWGCGWVNSRFLS